MNFFWLFVLESAIYILIIRYKEEDRGDLPCVENIKYIKQSRKTP